MLRGHRGVVRWVRWGWRVAARTSVGSSAQEPVPGWVGPVQAASVPEWFAYVESPSSPYPSVPNIFASPCINSPAAPTPARDLS